MAMYFGAFPEAHFISLMLCSFCVVSGLISSSRAGAIFVLGGLQSE
jgi:hypothetical protein